MPSSSFHAITPLCSNHDNLSESELLEKLDAILQECPEVAHERDEYDYTLLHFAAMHRPLEFCNKLIELNFNAIKSQSDSGMLPFHFACRCNNVDNARYLFELYPESINVINSDHRYPIHLLFHYGCDCTDPDLLELAKFLLQHDEGAVKKRDIYGDLPLHRSIRTYGVDIVKLVYNSFPEAIYMKDNDGDTPLRLARDVSGDELVSFFEFQLEFVRQATEVVVPDDTGRLPLHRAILRRDVPVGTIKLMVAANPISARARDAKGLTPLHIACEIDDVEAVKYLIEQGKEALEIQDLGGNFPLHHACFAGLINVVKFILDQTDHGVSIRNTNGKFPIQLLMYDDECDPNDLEYFDRVSLLLRDKDTVDSLDYVDTFYQLLRSYPALQEFFVHDE